MISSENAGKVTEQGKFRCDVLRKNVGSNPIFCQFSRCWVHKRYSGIRGKLKDNSEFKCQLCTNQQTDIVENYPGINGQSL